MKKFYLHDISIHTNLNKNRLINECARIIVHFIKNLCLYNVDILESLKKIGR